jgi:hypothetical protein
VKDSLETGILDNNSNNMLHRMGRNVQQKSNSLAKHRAATQKSTETDELQSQVDTVKQLFKNAQAALTAAKGTSTRRKSGKAKAPSETPLLQASSSGRVLSRRIARSETSPDLPAAPATAEAEPGFILVEPMVLPLPFNNLPSTPTPVESSPPCFGDNLAWVDNLLSMSDTSQLPLYFSDYNTLADTAPYNYPTGDGDHQYSADEWYSFLANFGSGGEVPDAPSGQYQFGT